MRKIAALVIAGVLSLTAMAYQPISPTAAVSRTISTANRFDSFYRTELYFGRSIPDGGLVSDEEWNKFLADVVTPRFPEGFTILKATGQYREHDGTIEKESSEILVFFYPVKTRVSSRRRIEEIRRAYIKQFKQESVLRLDYPTVVRVTF